MLKSVCRYLGIVAILVATIVSDAAPEERDAEVQPIVDAINAKLEAGIEFVADDFKKEIAKLEKISAKRRKSGKGEAAGPVFVIAQVYDVVRDPEKTLETYERILRDFPESEYAELAKHNAEVIRPAAQMQKARRELVVGVKFPDFEKKDLDGRPMSVSGLKGKVVLVDFWATFCPPCMAAMPELKRVYKEYRRHGFEILGINLNEDPEALPRAVDRLELTWSQYHDADNELAIRYGVNQLPQVFLLDGDGKIFATDEDLQGENLDAAIRKALGLKNED